MELAGFGRVWRLQLWTRGHWGQRLVPPQEQEDRRLLRDRAPVFSVAWLQCLFSLAFLYNKLFPLGLHENQSPFLEAFGQSLDKADSNLMINIK